MSSLVILKRRSSSPFPLVSMCRKKVAKFVYSASLAKKSRLFGPSYAPFLDLSRERTVYCNLNLWIQFVSSDSSFSLFPNMHHEYYHPCALSLTIRRAVFLVGRGACCVSRRMETLSLRIVIVIYFRTRNSWVLPAI